MKLLTILLVAVICSQTKAERRSLWDSFGQLFGIRENNSCDRDAVPILRDALNDFTIRLTKRAAYYSNNNNFVISPYTIWLSLASIAEHAEKSLQGELFAILSLPDEWCIRSKMYQLASNIETPGQDVDFKRRRALVIDEQVRLNNEWVAHSDQYKTLEYLPARYDEENLASMLRAMGIQSPLEFYGHSIILDRLYYEGSWTSAFSEAYIEQAPFYNDLGQAIGSTEFMKMRSRVRLAHIPIIDAKVLELPVGTDGRYTMLLTMGVKSNTIKTILELMRNSIIFDIISALTLSLVPIEVAVPRFIMSHGYNAKPMLEDMGFAKVFVDPSATRYISDPPALPSYYLQRLDINITSSYIRRESHANNNPLTSFFDTVSNAATGLASAVGRDFIANRPFLFTLLDTKTRVPVFTGLYSHPNELPTRNGWGWA